LNGFLIVGYCGNKYQFHDFKVLEKGPQPTQFVLYAVKSLVDYGHFCIN
jgi:hypothetical protein